MAAPERNAAVVNPIYTMLTREERYTSDSGALSIVYRTPDDLELLRSRIGQVLAETNCPRARATQHQRR